MANDAAQFLRDGQSHQFAEPPDFAAAERAYRAATYVSPEWGEPYHWLGFVLTRLGNLEGAADAYRRAIHLLAGDPRPLIALGGLQRLRGQYEEAIRSLETGLALGPLPQLIALLVVAFVGTVFAIRLRRSQPLASRLVIASFCAHLVNAIGSYAVHTYSYASFDKWQGASVHGRHIAELYAVLHSINVAG